MTLPICIRFNKEQKIDNADFYIAQNDLADFVSDFNKEQELTMPIAKNDLADIVSDFNKEQELTMPIFISRKK